jgi:hypothetical protein
VVVLLAALGYMVYSFVLTGETEQTEDGRQALLLNEAEKDLLLTEMRSFLLAVQQISDGVTKEDLELVASSARAVGAAAQQSVPANLTAKLPLEFKRLGFDTHRQFDALALDAEQLGDSQHSLKQLSGLMNNCIACHSTYKIKVVANSN